jgi:hypothetical protein
MANGNTAALLAMQKRAALKAVKTAFRKDYLFRAELPDQPPDMDLFVKEISYGRGTIESRKIPIANGEMAFPDKRTAGSVTAILYDNENGDVSRFIESLQKKIFNEDGTANLPVEYLFKLKLFRIRDDASEYLECEWDVYLEENNDYSGDTSKVTEHGTFSVTFQKFSSIGAKRT